MPADLRARSLSRNINSRAGRGLRPLSRKVLKRFPARRWNVAHQVGRMATRKNRSANRSILCVDAVAGRNPLASLFDPAVHPGGPYNLIGWMAGRCDGDEHGKPNLQLPKSH